MKRLLQVIAFIAIISTQSLRAQYEINPNDIDMDMMRKVQLAQIAINGLYVDSVDAKKVAEDAINGMLSKLDPNSAYSNAEETKKLNEPLQGGFGGIGIQFNMLDDSLIVIATVPKGPSEKAGILAGDRIIAVDGVAIAGVKMSRDMIMKKLRGEVGTKTVLTIARGGKKKPLTFKITRATIPMPTIDAYYMIAPGIGYVHLERFGAESDKELRKAIQEMQKQGMHDLILDFQMNGGGYLEAAVDIANEFLTHRDLIVFTEGRSSPRRNFYAKGGGIFRDGRVAILVDEYTASAAEIVSGAIQDHDRGIIIGRRTFGKGLVQRPIPLPDGSMIRLTVAHYYTPSGRCIQKPYEKGKKEDYEKDLENRYNRGEFTSIDSIHLDSTKVYYTLKAHRSVYSGGGIMPDYFIPLDTTKVTKYHSKLRQTDVIVNEVLRYVDCHREEIKRKYPEFNDFKAQFVVPQALVDSIRSRAEKEKQLKPENEDEWNRTLEDLRFSLKTQIAYNLWERNEYYRFFNERSDIVKKALELLGDSKTSE